MASFIVTFTQIIALVRKELLALIKEPASRALLIAPAFLQALLYGYGATYDLTHVPYAVLDQSRSAASTELLARIDGTGVFVRAATLTSPRQIAEMVDAEKALLVLSIPPDFAARLGSGQPAPLQLILDGRNSSTAGSAASHVGAIVAAYNASLGTGAPGIRVERRAWFNPNLESRWNMMPGLIAALSMLQTLLLAALSVAREREQGTFDQLLVTPLTPMQILIGKALPSILIGLLLTINGTYLHIFLSADKVTAETLRFGNSYLYIDLSLYAFLGFIFVARNCVQGIGKPQFVLGAGAAELVARVAVCLLLPAALAGGVVSAEAPQAAVYGLCVADPCAWIAADAVLCIPFIKNIMRENYDYLYGSGQKLIER